jgi:hypothetical protein
MRIHASWDAGNALDFLTEFATVCALARMGLRSSPQMSEGVSLACMPWTCYSILPRVD